MSPNNPNLKYFLGFVMTVVIIVLIMLKSKRNTTTSSYKSRALTGLSSSVNTNYLTKSMLEEMNTDVGIKSIELDYCSEGCSIDSGEKSIYECEYQDYLDSDWSQCSQTCGDTGTRTRTKRILFDFGENCDDKPAPMETEACNRVPCPIDCVVGDWREWSQCSAPCGDGVKSRSRAITTPAQYGGAVCPPTEENNVPCNNGDCCVTADWSSSSEGFEGSGCTQTRTVKKVVSSYYPDLTGCPAADIVLESRNICDISLQNGTLKEGQVYSYNDVNTMLGSQSDISIPINTKLIVTLQNNNKYIVGPPKTVFTYTGEISASGVQTNSQVLGKSIANMTIKAIQLLTTSASFGMSCTAIGVTISRDGTVIHRFSYTNHPNLETINNWYGLWYFGSLNILEGDTIGIEVKSNYTSCGSTGVLNPSVTFFLS